MNRLVNLLIFNLYIITFIISFFFFFILLFLIIEYNNIILIFHRSYTKKVRILNIYPS